MDSSFDDMFDRLNRGEDTFLSGPPSDDGRILGKSTLIVVAASVFAAVITMAALLYPLRNAFQPVENAQNVGGKTVNAEELYEIGNQYYYGRGVEQDYAKARTYYEQAAEMGCADACNDLGVLYHYGSGVEQNYKKARTYYEQAAQMGNASALTNLGILFEYGLGVEQDSAKAETYYEQAIEKGETRYAPENLARVREKMNPS